MPELSTAAAHHFVRGNEQSTFEDERVEPLEALSYVQGPDGGGGDLVPDGHGWMEEWPKKQPVGGLPSWVPDFGQPMIVTRLWRPGFKAACDISPFIRPGVLSLQEPLKTSRVLSLDGRKFDTVIDVAATTRLDSVALPYQLQFWFELLIRSPINGYHYGDCLDTLQRTLVAGQPLLGQADSKESFKDFILDELRRDKAVNEARFNQVLEQLSILASGKHNSALARSILQGSEDISAKNAHRKWCPAHGICTDPLGEHATNVFRTPYVKMYWSRNLCVTEKGYLGLLPRSVAKGDDIFLLAGARVPFVVRHTFFDDMEDLDEAEKFILVGEAYVNGIMNGEALVGDYDGFKTVQLV